MAELGEISEFLQRRLQELGKNEVAAVEAARWLDEAGLLRDSDSRPGLPLRNLLRGPGIPGSEQRPPRENGHWFIVRRTGPVSTEAPTPTPAPVPAMRTDTPETHVEGDITRASLLAADFEGFVRFKGIDLNIVPPKAGVYAVLRENADHPSFLDVNRAGWFKDRDPTVAVASLVAAWPEGSHCVYVGKAGAGADGSRGLRARVREFRRFGDGHKVGHSGGRRIWQLADADDYVLAWKATGNEDPHHLEGAMLRAFQTTHGKLPIGNQNAGRLPT